MRLRSIFPLAALAVAIPAAGLSFGTLEDIRYKIKAADGNRWEHLLGGGDMVRGDEHPGTITFTFDDGPDHRTTPLLLDQLDRFGVKAAFFVEGWKIHDRTAGGAENEEVLRDIHARGHFIGSHTFSHKEITSLDDGGWREEITQVEQVMRSITGERPFLFRPPFGKFHAPSLGRLMREGYTVVMWNLDSLDWKAGSARDVLRNAKKVIEANPEGGVFLMHDTNRSSVEAFPLIVEWIDERNAALAAAGKRPLCIVGIEHYIEHRGRRE